MHHAFEKSRENMVEGQVRPNRVTDLRLLEALRRVPRERFVPRRLQSAAYADGNITLDNGRCLLAPATLARLIQGAGVRASDIALDIGCGTGYAAALLGGLANTVIGIDSDAAATQEADKILHTLGIVNAAFVRQDALEAGYAAQGPYNVILVNGAVAQVPAAIQNQLAEGGRLVTIIMNRKYEGTAVCITRTGKTFHRHPLFDAAAPVLPGFRAEPSFIFSE